MTEGHTEAPTQEEIDAELDNLPPLEALYYFIANVRIAIQREKDKTPSLLSRIRTQCTPLKTYLEIAQSELIERLGIERYELAKKRIESIIREVETLYLNPSYVDDLPREISNDLIDRLNILSPAEAWESGKHTIEEHASNGSQPTGRRARAWEAVLEEEDKK